MPRLTQPAAIRRLLATDRPWAIYALGDLAPGFFERCEWFAAPGDEPGLALLYRAFATPVLFTQGRPSAVRQVLDEIGPQPEMYLSIRPVILPLVRERHDVDEPISMWRMALEPGDFRPVGAAGAVRLGVAALQAVRALYADGEDLGQSPDFFSGDMLEQGVFFGIWEAETLIAVAGTHLVSPQDSVGAVGNVYTRRDRRGRGLAAAVTGAVTGELVSMGLRTIGLNVNQQNAAAMRVYERLGYQKYCPFVEGMAFAKVPAPVESRL